MTIESQPSETMTMTTPSHSIRAIAQLLNKLWRAEQEQSGEKVDFVTAKRKKKFDYEE